VVGDVSGKGVPAALFMAVSRTLLRATAMQNVSPAECLGYMNRVLRRQTEEGVYVTVFYGILHTGTGEVDYAIGGHNPPYVVRSSGEVAELAEPAGPLVGLLRDLAYETGRITLQPGDSIFLYTDGVTEAEDPEQKFFGERRLRELLHVTGSAGPEATVQAVLAEVERFAAGAPRSDDITTLALRYRG
jgi:sigma-B regulation protein RsbU (phosphoserine phosphatase)